METFEDLLKFEDKKHKEFFLPYYQKVGWKVVKDYVGTNSDYDVLIDRNGQQIRIDEKAIRKEWNDFVIEIIQDLKTGSPSWLYKKKDIYLYASWQDIEQINPSSLYEVRAEILKEYIAKEAESLLEYKRFRISNKVFGTTLFVVIPLKELLQLEIARQLKTQN